MFTILHAFQNKIFQLFSQLDITKASDFFATFPKKTLRPRFLISLHRNKISQRNRRKGFFIISRFSSKITMPTKHQTMSTQQPITKPIHNKTKKQFFIFKICAKLILLYTISFFCQKPNIYFFL
jgi:hypothetical protein